MKLSIHLRFLAAIFLLPIALCGQGTLQFNAVKYLNHTVTGAGPTSCCSLTNQTLTVPAGKVWKIEATSLKKAPVSNPGQLQNFSTGEGMSIGDLLVYRAGTNTFSGFASTPIWLPAGTYTWAIHYDNIISNVWTAGISAIEFNIIP